MTFRGQLRSRWVKQIGFVLLAICAVVVIFLTLAPSYFTNQNQARCAAARELGETELLAPVTLIVTVNEAAGEWLRKHNEGISGWISFDGDGDPGHDCKTAPSRDITLGSQDFTMDGPGVIVLSEIAISKRLQERLTDKDFHFGVNVVSARRTYPDNGLLCASPTGRISALNSRKRTLRIHCTKLATD